MGSCPVELGPHLGAEKLLVQSRHQRGTRPNIQLPIREIWIPFAIVLLLNGLRYFLHTHRSPGAHQDACRSVARTGEIYERPAGAYCFQNFGFDDGDSGVGYRVRASMKMNENSHRALSLANQQIFTAKRTVRFTASPVPLLDKQQKSAAPL